MKPEEVDPSERLKTAATAMASAMKAKTAGGEKATTTTVDMGMIQDIMADWPALPVKAAKQTTDTYGPPNEAIPSRLIWYNNGPWKRTTVYRDEIPHNFPAPHTDVIENVIDYHVPTDKISDIVAYDGSVIIERTKGEVIARCDMEAANFISINLMHDIVTGKLTVDEARKKYSEVMTAYLMDRSAPYAEGLQFNVSIGETGEQDEVMIAASLMDQLKEKAKNLIDGQ